MLHKQTEYMNIDAQEDDVSSTHHDQTPENDKSQRILKTVLIQLCFLGKVSNIATYCFTKYNFVINLEYLIEWKCFNNLVISGVRCSHLRPNFAGFERHFGFNYIFNFKFVILVS